MQLSRLATCLLVCAALGFGGCYTKYFPENNTTPQNYPASTPIQLVVGILPTSSEAGANVNRIHAATVAADFARQLESSRTFKAVIFPYSNLAPIEPDLIFTMKVNSRFDRQDVKNFFRQVLAGGTLLLLQPVLPVQWDLTVQLEALVTRPSDGWSKKYKARSTYRFESTWTQPSGQSIQNWHDDTYREAVRGLVSQLAQDQALRQGSSGGAAEKPPL